MSMEGGGVDREKEREIFELEILNGGGGLRERVKGNNPSTLGREREGERERVKREARVEKKGRERERERERERGGGKTSYTKKEYF